MQEALYGPGEVIFTAHEHDDRLFYIVKGCVDCYITLPGLAEEKITMDRKEVT
jgi:CRP-like cAMP-binding protein